MERDYTISLDSDESMAENTLIWRDLYAANFAFDSPFQLILADGEMLHIEKVVRIIPKRRLVAFAKWKNKNVVAKLFYDPDDSKRLTKKDAAGVHALHENKIPTPALLYMGTANDSRIGVLLYERIFDAKNLQVLWEEDPGSPDTLEVMKSVIIEIATQHVLGVTQKDLHMKNFLVTDKLIYTLDGGQIECSMTLLPKKESLRNLALFLSQLGVGKEEVQRVLYLYYAKARGWLVKSSDMIKVAHLIRQWSAQRWQKFKKKIMRNCTDFARFRSWGAVGMYHRDYAEPEFNDFLCYPERAFNPGASTVLKAGRSSTVVKKILDGHEFVIKRYNMKSLIHRLRRMLRPTRAVNAWYIAQKLQLFFVPTAKPAAYLERRWFGLRGKSYYITAYIAGEHAGDFFERIKGDQESIDSMVNRIAALFKNLMKLNISHGDLKMTNIIISHHHVPMLIDFDGAREHTSRKRLRQAWNADIKRFLRNFTDKPALQQAFTQALLGQSSH